MKKKGVKILHVITDKGRILDIPRVLDELGHSVYTANKGTHLSGFHLKESKEIEYGIEEYNIECVTSYNFSESISYACMKKGIPYIAWVYDTPQKELYTSYAFYPCNYIFVFDKKQEKRLKEIGLKNVFFMPLAIHGEKIKLELTMDVQCEACDVAFVGQTYYMDNVEEVVEDSPECIRDEIYECIEKNFMKWEDDLGIHEKLSEKCAEYFDSLEKIPVKERYPYITKEFYYEAAVLSRMLAYRERIHILNTLAEKYDVKIYTFDKNIKGLSDKVKVCPGIKYDAGISCIYRDAKININNTLHCIETGACMRVFEVMGAGGFLISNYQKELEELFVPGKEIVLYHNEEELLHLVDYYLAHEEERKEIARNGQRKVLAYHTLHIRFQKIMQIVYEQEKNRKESYLEMQRKEITKYINQALESGEEECINDLYMLFYNPMYEVTIGGTTEFEFVKEMLFLWKQEKDLSGSNIFENLKSIDQLRIYYLRIKHLLWRIESDCEYEDCQKGVCELVEKKVPAAFLAWQIKVNILKRKKVYLALSEYLWNVNPARGIEFITYGLFDFPGDKDLLMYKANFLLEAQCYFEALEALKSISNPDEEVLELIVELEVALGMRE